MAATSSILASGSSRTSGRPGLGFSSYMTELEESLRSILFYLLLVGILHKQLMYLYVAVPRIPKVSC